jgi:hypothetical protein
MSLTLTEASAHYDSMKRSARKHLQRTRIVDSVRYIEVAARIAYRFNFRYADDELEELLRGIADTVLDGDRAFEGAPRKVVFYDSFGISRILALQYLRALKSQGYEITYVSPAPEIGLEVLEELQSDPASQVVRIDRNKTSFLAEMRRVANEIRRSAPSLAFLHCTPWDVFGTSLWSYFDNVERYLINLCDHGFWLGKGCADYVMEFRSHGCRISHHYRGIPPQRLLWQPFYPVPHNVPFQGLPAETEGKFILFSGSAPYKVYGRDNIFLRLVKTILERNQSAIFVFASGGVEPLEPLRQFIKENGLEDRFLLLGNRNDIDGVIRHVDVFINTFPMIGGLMTQLAVLNGKPVVGFTEPDLLSFNDTEEFLQVECKGVLVKTTEAAFLDYLQALIDSETERERNVRATRGSIVTVEEFSDRLASNLTTHRPVDTVNFEEEPPSRGAISEFYLEVENSFLREHYPHMLSQLRLQLFRDDVGLGVKALLGSTDFVVHDPLRAARSLSGWRAIGRAVRRLERLLSPKRSVP